MPENLLRVVDEATGVTVLERGINDPSLVTVGKPDEDGNVVVTIGMPEPVEEVTEEPKPKKAAAKKPASKK